MQNMSLMVNPCCPATPPFLSDGLRVMGEMEERARQEPQFRPRPHVFLALMRAFAEEGKLPRTRELAERMVPALGWHVWPEDRAEAEELVMEAAVNAGEVRGSDMALTQHHAVCVAFFLGILKNGPVCVCVQFKEARQVLSQIVRDQGGNLHFTARGDQVQWMRDRGWKVPGTCLSQTQLRGCYGSGVLPPEPGIGNSNSGVQTR